MIAALVCGRAEQDPFPGRNLFPLLGRPLASYPLMAARHAAKVDRVFLSTDDDALARVGAEQGAQVIGRPPELRGKQVPLEAILRHGVESITRQIGSAPDLLVVLLANAPTVTAAMIDQGVARMEKTPAFEAVISVALRRDFSPCYALRLTADGMARPYVSPLPSGDEPVYFPDALLWVLRPPADPAVWFDTVRPNEIVNPATQRVAPLVHEGYGDIDYPWQVPAAAEWLRRNGFDETRTPYPTASASLSAPSDRWRTEITRVPPERRVLVTTIPFCERNDAALRLLKEAGAEVVINPVGRRLKESDVERLVEPFGILVAGTEPLSSRVLEAAPHLKLIARVGIGLDNVNLRAARKRGITVTYTPDAPAPAVAELTVGLMIDLVRRISTADRHLRQGVWHRHMGLRLSTLTVGIVGCGRVGRRVVEHLANGFPGVTLLANDLKPDLSLADRYGVGWVDKETLFRKSDIVSLHVPLTPDTRGLLGIRELGWMKPGAFLVNTARGEIVDEAALADALRVGRLGGAALDVFSDEPYTGPLAAEPRCLLTCHMGSMSQDCRERMEWEACQEAVRFLRGEALRQPVPETEGEPHA